MEHQMISKSVDEVKEKLGDFDGRLTNLEQQQQKHEPLPSSPKNLLNHYSKVENATDLVLKKAVKTEKQHSICVSCSFGIKYCLFYFEDLYDFDKKKNQYQYWCRFESSYMSMWPSNSFSWT